MSTVLRVTFKSKKDIERLMASTDLPIIKIHWKGEKRFPGSKRNKEVNQTSLMNISASDADFSEPELQVKDSIKFLTKYKRDLKKVCRLASRRPILDFGRDWRNMAIQSDIFPAKLLQEMGKLGIDMGISLYNRRIDLKKDNNPI